MSRSRPGTAAQLVELLGPEGLPDGGRRLAVALDLVDALVDLGWLPPERLVAALDPEPSAAEPSAATDDGLEELAAQPAVRSLSEDLAAAAARRERVVAAVHANRQRAARATARSQDLSRALASRGVPEPDGARPSAEAAARRVEELEAEVAQLRTALQNRPPIEHAVGVVMAALACDAETGWAALVGLSQSSNRKVRDVAASINRQVATRELTLAQLASALRRLLDTPSAAPAARPPRRSPERG